MFVVVVVDGGWDAYLNGEMYADQRAFKCDNDRTLPQDHLLLLLLLLFFLFWWIVA